MLRSSHMANTVRAQREADMRAYLQAIVTPSADSGTLVLLQHVLFEEPFNIRTPAELVASGGRMGDTVLTLLEGEARKRGLATPSATVRREYVSYVTTHCRGHPVFADDAAEDAELSTTAQQYQPMVKKARRDGGDTGGGELDAEPHQR